jgi:hypothetical protein
MFVSHRHLVVGLAVLTLPTAAIAQQTVSSPSALKLKLTEQEEPESKPWEDPARLSFIIDPNGPDEFQAQVNMELGFDLNFKGEFSPSYRDRTIAVYVRYQRDNGGDDRQNNLELGLKYSVGHSAAALWMPYNFDLDNLSALDRTRLAMVADARGRGTFPLNLSYDASVGYKRTAVYADADKSPCDASPNIPQCQTQYNESIRASVVSAVYVNWLEGGDENGLKYSIAPKIGVDYDHLFNSPLDPTTGISKRGGYFSALGGLAAVFAPSFVNPSWEVKGSAQLRQKISASNSRSPSIESSAEKFKASATYYFIRPATTVKGGWRAGFGVEYTKGGDPLTGKPDDEKIVLAFRLGQF